MASSSSGRALNATEIALHRHVLGCGNQTATQGDLEKFQASKEDKQSAINFLLSAGMLKLMKDDKKNKMFYKAVKVKEAKTKSVMDKDTQTILSQIEDAGTEAIWTKALERRTDLPQKVVQKCLKLLEGQGLVKQVKSVKYPTRKMYMLFHLNPSVELTGGVWYTDQEFDSAFVRILLDQIYNYVAKQTLPTQTSLCSRPLYPRSEISRFPSLIKITDWVKRSGIAEVRLKKEDIEMLLRVLEFDGRVEKLPASGLLQMSEDEEEQMSKKRGKKRKDVGGKRKRKGEDTDDESDGDRKKRRKKNEDDSEDEARLKKKGKGRGRKGASEDEQDSESDSDAEKRRRKREALKLDGPNSDEETEEEDGLGNMFSEMDVTDAFVYRAVRPTGEEASSNDAAVDSLGFDNLFSGSSTNLFSGMSTWLGGGDGHLPWGEAPCVRCPQADFCHEGGPVNASSCEYFKTWLDPDRVMVQMKADEGEGEATLAIETDSF